MMETIKCIRHSNKLEGRVRQHACTAQRSFPTYAFQTAVGPAWLTIIDGQINRLRLSEAVECEVNNAFVSDWQFDPTEPVKSDGQPGIVFDNAGYGTHFVFEATVSTQPNPINVLNLASGNLEPHMIQGTLMGVVSSPTMATPYIITKTTTPALLYS